MRVVITGGAASGKSAHAEGILCAHAERKSRLYLATMQPFGESADKKIARHRELRAGKGFETAECYLGLRKFRATRHFEGILLECMSNLLANELFAPEGAGEDAVQAILNGIDVLEKQCDTLVIVTNEIFSDGAQYEPQTMQYMKMLGEINRRLFAYADIVAESVCGILVNLKGGNLL